MRSDDELAMMFREAHRRGIVIYVMHEPAAMWIGGLNHDPAGNLNIAGVRQLRGSRMSA
jgi:hypothetical protein